jgi:hypothetical protein
VELERDSSGVAKATCRGQMEKKAAAQPVLCLDSSDDDDYSSSESETSSGSESDGDD